MDGPDHCREMALAMAQFSLISPAIMAVGRLGVPSHRLDAGGLMHTGVRDTHTLARLRALSNGGLLVADQTLPVQFDGLWHRAAPAPERVLALSVLLQAAEDLQKGRDAQDRCKQRLHRDAYRWVISDDRSWAYSFVNLCDMLNLSPEYLRAGLLNSRRTLQALTAVSQ
jgi:hypothetical protein